VPVALQLDEHRWRIYFSSRDGDGRSHCSFFEADLRAPRRTLRESPQPVLSPGGLGTFDEDGAMGSWIVEEAGRLLLYYFGWNRALSVPFRNAIGVAESTDRGESFTKLGPGPLLDRNRRDPYFVSNPCVVKEGGRWRMWYLSCVGWEALPAGPRHRYLIKHTDSPDGLEWHGTDRLAIDFASADEYAISRPCVLRDPDCYRMWYSHRGSSYRIGYAESPDGLSWQRRDDDVGIDVAPSGWDAEMVCYAYVFDAEGQRYMLYNGNGYGATGIGLAVLESD